MDKCKYCGAKTLENVKRSAFLSVADKNCIQAVFERCERLQAENEELGETIASLEREIESLQYDFELLREEITQALDSNYKAKSKRLAKPNVAMADEFITFCEGKIAALRGIDDFIDNIIKETEAENSGGD